MSSCFLVHRMKNYSEITIKENRLSKQMIGELPMSSSSKVLFETIPFKKVHNSLVYSHPATHNSSTLGLDLSEREN